MAPHGSPEAPDAVRWRALNWAFFAVAAAIAVVLVGRTWADWPRLWTDPIHDRNAHLDVGVQHAADLRHLRIVDLLRDVHSFRSWPPLHDGLLVGLAVLLSGLDPRAAIVPSAVAFAATAVTVAAIVRALLPRPTTFGPHLAGVAAGALVLASPAMRAFAGDVMLESPGAALSAAVLLAAVRDRQRPDVGRARVLGIALTSLFFTKYNYWTVAVLAVAPIWWPLVRSVVAELGALLRSARSGVRRARRGATGAGIATVSAASLVGVSAAQGFQGPTAIWTATVATWIAALLVSWWCRSPGRRWLDADRRARTLLRWHVAPLLVWFCLPGKLQGFLWFQIPLTNAGEHPSGDPFGGLTTYRAAFVDDYHPAAAAAAVVGLLALVGLIAWRRRRLARGAGMVVLFVLVSIGLLLPHPNRKSRFLHTVVPAVWVLAGVGVGTIVQVDRRWLCGVAVGATAIGTAGLGTSFADAAAAPEGGLQRQRPSLLPVVESYLPELEAAEHPAVLSDVPMRFLARWTQRARDPGSEVVETEVPDVDVARPGAADAAALQRWLDDEPVDLVVVVRFGPSSPWFVAPPGNDGLAPLIDLMAQRRDFRPVRRRIRPEGGTDREAAVVELWHRVGPAGR